MVRLESLQYRLGINDVPAILGQERGTPFPRLSECEVQIGDGAGCDE